MSVLLPAPGAPVMPTVYAASAERVGEARDLAGGPPAALHEREQPRERGAVAVASISEELVGAASATSRRRLARGHQPSARITRR